LLTSLARTGEILLQPLLEQLLSVGSIFSAASLASALFLAVACLLWPRLGRRRTVKARVLIRALFPRHLVAGVSNRADIGLWLFNTFPAIVLLGAIIVTAAGISGPTAQALTRLFGPVAPAALPAGLARAITTVALFLAYEFALWLNHVAFHKVPFLWEFHKVHHTAETMTPLTVFRVHPVESLVFANVTAIAVGLVSGALHYVLGPAASAIEISGTNVIVVLLLYLFLHLQHSHLWISFTGVAGRLLISPAHHQIHHSANPKHFNRNFGRCLAIWDWAFGTLHVPAKRRERLTFGADVRAGTASPHSVTGVLLTPFAEAARTLGRPRAEPIGGVSDSPA
jgi:sterol desaturase/sphingolipid hydroxylase (fatty acid hydroxylase superfamily)